MRQNPCPIRSCPRNIAPTSPYGICAHHTDVVDCLIFALPRIKMKPAAAPPAGSGLIIPKPGQADQLIAEFVAQGGGRTERRDRVDGLLQRLAAEQVAGLCRDEGDGEG